MKLLLSTFLLSVSLCFQLQGQEVLLSSTKEGIKVKIEQIIKHSKNQGVLEAQQNLQEALVLAEGINNKFLIANTSIALSKLYAILSDYSKAEVNMLRAVNEYRALDNQEYLGIAYKEYANLFIEQGKFSRATDYLALAETIFNNEGMPLNMAHVNMEKGRIALENEMYVDAINIINKTTSQLSNAPDKSLYADALFLLGKAHYQNFDYKLALKNSTESYEISKRYNYKTLEADNALLLSQIYMQQDKKDQAYALLDASNAINKELIKGSEGLTATEDTSKRLEEKDEVITSLSEDIVKQERDLRLRTLIVLLSIAFITILSLLTLSLYKNNRIREKANKLLLQQRDQLKVAKENAEKATKAKAQFLSTITHELRTPLYAVTGLTNLLIDDNPNTAQKQHLKSLKFSGDYLLSLINDILDLNKFEAAKVKLRHDRFNLKKRVNDVIIALDHSAKKNKNTLHLEFDDNIPTYLKGDAIKLSQVLINLIGNATKFTKNGDIWIRLKRLKNRKTNCTVEFQVEDNGVGISKEQQKNIFESFAQGSLEINRKFGGTGLGLSIVKQILELMGSQIKLESDLGKGSIFKFNMTFKIADNQIDIPKDTLVDKGLEKKLQKISSESPIPVTEDSNGKSNRDTETRYERLKNKTILVVEDNKINQMITRKIIEKNSASCTVADNGEKAIALCKDLTFDLVLMDIHMPGIGGIEATKKIREFDEDIPIIALTAVTLEDDGRQFFENGFTDIIPKPYNNKLFFKVIENALPAEEAVSKAPQI